jgi:hypothetical protein
MDINCSACGKPLGTDYYFIRHWNKCVCEDCFVKVKSDNKKSIDEELSLIKGRLDLIEKNLKRKELDKLSEGL